MLQFLVLANENLELEEVISNQKFWSIKDLLGIPSLSRWHNSLLAVYLTSRAIHQRNGGHIHILTKHEVVMHILKWLTAEL